MKIHRFYLKESPEINESTKTLSLTDGELLHQWIKVLRFKPGDSVELFEKSGATYLVKLIELTKRFSTSEIIESTQRDISLPQVSLFLSVIKKDNFELVVQKITEIGVSEITPITSSRSQTKPLNFDRLNKIIIEATEQSGGVKLPTMNEAIPLEEALKGAQSAGKKIIVCEFDGVTLHEFEKKPEDHIALFIGPEGGWSDEDRALFEKYSATKISFGEKVLRAETAAIVGVWEFGK